MTKGRSPWQEGRRAWERLDGWHEEGPTARRGHPDDGGGALAALVDVGLVRRLLDQAELVAVKTARRHGKSWAEISTKLGVTRQSAWERWRDLDETSGPPRPQPDMAREMALDLEAAVVESAETATRQAHAARRRSKTVVPSVIGMSWDRARDVLLEKSLVAAGADPDGLPLTAMGWPHGMVTDQSPESGARVPAGSAVTLWLDRGGGGSAGVREPRRPKPSPETARAVPYEPSGEAVG